MVEYSKVVMFINGAIPIAHTMEINLDDIVLKAHKNTLQTPDRRAYEIIIHNYFQHGSHSDGLLDGESLLRDITHYYKSSVPVIAQDLVISNSKWYAALSPLKKFRVGSLVVLAISCTLPLFGYKNDFVRDSTALSACVLILSIYNSAVVSVKVNKEQQSTSKLLYSMLTPALIKPSMDKLSSQLLSDIR